MGREKYGHKFMIFKQSMTPNRGDKTSGQCLVQGQEYGKKLGEGCLKEVPSICWYGKVYHTIFINKNISNRTFKTIGVIQNPQYLFLF